jgi:hypothetical protein
MGKRKLVEALAGLGVVVVLAGLIYCGRPAALPKDGPPPIRVSYRPSKIPRQGMVAGLNNPSVEESLKLVAVFIQGKGETEGRSYRLDRVIKPLDSISLGWLEFGGWKLKPGDKLRIRCEEYKDDLECEVSD